MTEFKIHVTDTRRGDHHVTSILSALLGPGVTFRHTYQTEP